MHCGLGLVFSNLIILMKPHHYLLPLPLLLPALVGWSSELEKRRKSQLEIRTINWKQQWDKRTNSNNKNITNKRYEAKKLFTWEAGSKCWPASPLHFLPPGKGCSSSWKGENLFAHPWQWSEIVLNKISVWPCPLSHVSSQLLQTMNPVLGWNQDTITPGVPPLSLMVSALARGGPALEPDAIGSGEHRGSFWSVSDRSPPCSSSQKSCYANPIQMNINFLTVIR